MGASGAKASPAPSGEARGLVLRMLALVLVSGASGFVANAWRTDGVRLRDFAAPTMCEGTHGVAQETAEISPAAAARLCGRRDVVLADTRPAARFTEGHVAGATHLPCDATGAASAAALQKLDAARATTVIVYGEGTDDARPVAASLRARLPKGTRVLLLTGGFASWEAASLACTSGPCDECGVSSP